MTDKPEQDIGIPYTGMTAQYLGSDSSTVTFFPLPFDKIGAYHQGFHEGVLHEHRAEKAWKYVAFILGFFACGLFFIMGNTLPRM